MKNLSRNKLRLHRKNRIKSKIKGTMKRPRFCVFKSLTRLEAQIIDDEKNNTLLYLDTQALKVKNNLEGAKNLGKELAKTCKEKKIEEVVFDRGGYKYHGKIKAIADEARKGGLKF